MTLPGMLGFVGMFQKIAALPVVVDGYRLEGLRAPIAGGRERLSTLLRFSGVGHEGLGEDVVYDEQEQLAFQRAGAAHDLRGNWTLAEVCERVESLDLFPEPPGTEVSRRYRVWAFESALLDLALRQAGVSLAQALDRPARAMRYVCSTRLGEPPTLEPVRKRLELDRGLRFKLDATSSWTPELIGELVATGALDSVDFKGFYRGTVVDQPADPVLYRRIAEAFPDAWLEDPDLSTPEAAAALRDAHDRITWDAPIHSIADIESLPFAPRMVNIKPSRVGGLRPLCAAYDYCAERGIGAYGGGQFELGPGRGQAQYLASLFHPDTPNDLAPVGYNEERPPSGLPSSPLSPAPSATGFRWGD
jgi:L-alanine-DL-glutamate epimerase-like enolase superfamily enzyme